MPGKKGSSGERFPGLRGAGVMSRPRLIFRRRVKLVGPLHLNLSLHHVGLGVSVPGASFSINDAGRRQASVGLAGSGLRLQQVWQPPRGSSMQRRINPSRPTFSHGVWIAGIVLAVLLAIALAASK